MSEKLNPFSGRLQFLFLASAILPGCATWQTAWVPEFMVEEPLPPIDFGEEPVVEEVQTHEFRLNTSDSVVGRLATVPIRDGDTLLDLARHYGLGHQHIVEANPDLDPWVPRAGDRALLPLQFILPDAPRKGIVINLAVMRLFYFADGKRAKVTTWPIGIGREGRSTPLGVMSLVRKAKSPTWYVPESIRRTHEQQGDPLPAVVPPGPDNPLGDYALYLSKPSYLIHGTNKPFSIGLRASNGCIRLYPEDIEQAFRMIPNKAPVAIVNQPYLLGWKGGNLYLEAHDPYEELDGKQEKRNILAKLRQIAAKSTLRLDWLKIRETIDQARGIPIPIFEKTMGLNQVLASAVPLERPETLYGQPDDSGPGVGDWFVVTAITDDELKARRLAAKLNHLGPRIPARMIARSHRYRVAAGPFKMEKDARKTQRILREDFETRSTVIKPARSAVRKLSEPASESKLTIRGG